MKNACVCAILVAIAIVAGCDRRDNATTTPDRRGHAFGERGTPPGEATPGADETYYTVQPGDTLTSIAKAHGVPLEVLIRRNNISGDAVPARLVVPAKPR
ncbi:MAG TPA: LysM peptidoglycan-binding domain-containing protein [Planctomycetota bacterium]|nr:LysM peptidoglycan-binding domain-containing protein [Planctomycetota bacterium]